MYKKNYILMCCLLFLVSCATKGPVTPEEQLDERVVTNINEEFSPDVRTIYFANNSDAISEKEKEDLYHLVESLNDSKEPVYLLLEGQTDKAGEEDYNKVLGLKRATAVKDFLEDVGLDAKLIVTKTLGEYKSTAKDPAKDRKVVIKLYEPYDSSRSTFVNLL